MTDPRGSRDYVEVLKMYTTYAHAFYIVRRAIRKQARARRRIAWGWICPLCSILGGIKL
jgi:hypothetical protein